MRHPQIPLARIAILHHDSRHVREAARRQARGGGADEHARHDEEVGMRVRHARADLAHEREDDEGGDGVADERCDDEDEGAEDDEDAVKAHAVDSVGDGSRDGVQQARGGDGFAQGQAASGQDDDGPEEIVEVFLGQDAGAEEGDDGQDGDDAHVAEDVFELVAHAPEDDGDEGDAADVPLHTCESVSHRSDRGDGGAFAGVEGSE